MIIDMSEFLQISESEEGVIIPPPESTEEAITVVRALEAPGTPEFLSQQFSVDAVDAAYANAYAWYLQHMNTGLPNLRPGGPGALERNGPGLDLDATMLSGAEELVDEAWTEGPNPKDYTPPETAVLLAALRRVVRHDQWASPPYESLRTADYLARRAPAESERRWMGWYVLSAAEVDDVQLAA